MFEDIKGFSATPHIEQSDLTFVDPKVENDKVLKFDVVSGISCLMIVFFALTTTIATFLLWSQERDQLKLQRGRSGSDTSNSPSGGARRQGSFSRSSESQSSFASTGSAPSENSGCAKFLRSFSLMENIARLSKPRSKVGDQELEVMNGLRVLSCILIILGNSYYYTMRSPIQNLEVVQEWVQSPFFSMVLSADLIVDSFFWISAFLASYQLLVRMKLNDGKLPSNKFALCFNRFMRLWPLYVFVLFFFWRFMPLFGGEGPLFFEYQNMN